mgnify:CR=1 FL=1
MNLNLEFEKHVTRRQLFGLGAKGIGIAALASLMKQDGLAASGGERDPKTGGLKTVCFAQWLELYDEMDYEQTK